MLLPNILVDHKVNILYLFIVIFYWRKWKYEVCCKLDKKLKWKCFGNLMVVMPNNPAQISESPHFSQLQLVELAHMPMYIGLYLVTTWKDKTLLLRCSFKWHTLSVHLRVTWLLSQIRPNFANNLINRIQAFIINLAPLLLPSSLRTYCIFSYCRSILTENVLNCSSRHFLSFWRSVYCSFNQQPIFGLKDAQCLQTTINCLR